MRRFLLHVLPKGFVRIRHFGLLASVNVGSKLQRPRTSYGSDSMTFDQLWRMNLAEEKRRTDSASGSGAQPIDEESRSELELTDEDRAFLLEVGIRP